MNCSDMFFQNLCLQASAHPGPLPRLPPPSPLPPFTPPPPPVDRHLTHHSSLSDPATETELLPLKDLKLSLSPYCLSPQICLSHPENQGHTLGLGINRHSQNEVPHRLMDCSLRLTLMASCRRPRDRRADVLDASCALSTAQ